MAFKSEIFTLSRHSATKKIHAPELEHWSIGYPSAGIIKGLASVNQALVSRHPLLAPVSRLQQKDAISVEA